MLSIRQDQEENQNVAQAPTLGRQVGSISQGGGAGQRRNVSQRGSGFTNLQQYVTANENNANPELVRQRTAQAGTGLQQAQTGFENVAKQARTGLQGIQGVNTFVQGVLADPTKAAADKANLQRFQALRTGQEAIANPTDVLQPFTQAQTGFESQREQLAGGLRTDTTGTGLQNYIRSQRANPSLATQGENVLDRFLTESTTAGKTAIQQAQERAGQIQATQIPGISGEVEALRQQVEPLQFRTQQGIQSGINPLVREQENFITGLNKDYVAQQLGLLERQSDNPRFTKLEAAKARRETINKFNQRIAETDNAINSITNQINNSNKRINELQNIDFDNFEGEERTQKELEAQREIDKEASTIRDLQPKLNNISFDNNSLKRGLERVDLSLQPTLEEYETGLGLNRQQLLQKYDKDRFARINALSQLSGQSFQDLLNRGI
jgi:uncharacterized coiled-coil protein SlyX